MMRSCWRLCEEFGHRGSSARALRRQVHTGARVSKCCEEEAACHWPARRPLADQIELRKQFSFDVLEGVAEAVGRCSLIGND